jgi:hypothetical protein
MRRSKRQSKLSSSAVAAEPLRRFGRMVRRGIEPLGLARSWPEPLDFSADPEREDSLSRTGGTSWNMNRDAVDRQDRAGGSLEAL